MRKADSVDIFSALLDSSKYLCQVGSEWAFSGGTVTVELQKRELFGTASVIDEVQFIAESKFYRGSCIAREQCPRIAFKGRREEP